MIKTADWSAVTTTKALIIGENSTLQWKDEVVEHAMFLDYYFDHAPYDLGERSRYSEAKTIIELIVEITNGKCRPEQLHGTLLSNERLPRSPKGKRLYIPPIQAADGAKHIKHIIDKNPTIEYIFVMGLQANYYLQRFGLYNCGELSERFIHGAEPRRTGISAAEPFYQPVDAKPFREVCFRRYSATLYPNIEVIPILPVKSYPMVGSELVNFGESFEALKRSFREDK